LDQGTPVECAGAVGIASEQGMGRRDCGFFIAGGFAPGE